MSTSGSHYYFTYFKYLTRLNKEKDLKVLKIGTIHYQDFQKYEFA